MSNDTIPTKTCPKCKQVKPLIPEFWYKIISSRTGFDGWCICCRRKYQKQHRVLPFIPPKYPLAVKTCAKCGETYPATPEYFSRYRPSRSGLRSYCLNCSRQFSRNQQHKNRERYNKRNKQSDFTPYTIGTKYCPDCEQELPLSDFHRNATRPDGLKSICKSCSIKRTTEWRNKNPTESIEYKKQWRKQNPGSGRLAVIRYRARKRNLPDTYTTGQWIACLEYFNYCCAVCGTQLRDLFGTIEPHADHWIPLSSPDCLGTVAENMVCLCNNCNFSKNAKLPLEWLKEQYGTRKANEILARVQAYFEWAKKHKSGE